MGVDCIQSRKSRPTRKDPKSGNLYQLLLVKLYKLLSRRTTSQFNKVVLKRLCMAKMHKPVVSLSALARKMPKDEKSPKTLVVVGTITNDERLVDVPKMKVVALKFTKEAHRRIVEAGGSCLNFDTFARENPTGKSTCLLQGKRSARTSCKYFGKATGLPGSHARPRVQSVGRKFENGPRRRRMH